MALPTRFEQSADAGRWREMAPGFRGGLPGEDDWRRRLGRSHAAVVRFQPAPDNLAGATVSASGTYHQRSRPGSIVLADQDGHWMLTHDTAMQVLHAIWHNANRPKPHVGQTI